MHFLGLCLAIFDSCGTQWPNSLILGSNSTFWTQEPRLVNPRPYRGPLLIVPMYCQLLPALLPQLLSPQSSHGPRPPQEECSCLSSPSGHQRTGTKAACVSPFLSGLMWAEAPEKARGVSPARVRSSQSCGGGVAGPLEEWGYCTKQALCPLNAPLYPGS